MKKFLMLIVFILSLPAVYVAQEETPNPHDFGKMWTFENPPKDWFKEAYDFEPGDKWFDDVRKSSLRFASWCSASFVSPDGLIMTNHHCSRDVVGNLQEEGENFDKQGFYATTLADERKAEGLFVEQLIKVEKITDKVMSKVDMDDSASTKSEKVSAALEAVKKEYEAMSNWEDLRLQTVTYYSGGKFSLYGYKRYDDIRLVMLPELDLGFFGGDPDNFTYPRYNLDVTFWRAYDEDGEPVNSSAHYFKFNADGAAEGEPVFVVGNPGSTERYRTVAQLEYDRDYRYPMTYKFLKNRNDIMMEEYNEIKDDPSKEFEAQALLNTIAGVANGMKAYGGIVKGLNDDELFNRKVEMEEYIRSQSEGVTHWDELDAAYEKLNPYGWAITHLGPSPLRGKILMMLHSIHNFRMAHEEGDTIKAGQIKSQILSMTDALNDPKEVRYFNLFLKEVHEDIYPENTTMDNLLGNMSVKAYGKKLIAETKFKDKESAEMLLDKGKALTTSDDGFIKLATALIPQYYEAAEKFQASTEKRKNLESKIANQVFQVYGSDLPPDATFTLRISDGVIRGYDYNGTVAPVYTTYYGLYDRHYSHDEVFPWSLPERWLDNPPHELLKAPLNTVSTNDIIGGNSGSPLINKNKEAVGLIFDGNIQSLPGNFIFDEEYNRTVSVHAGGIMAALMHIYNADRLVNELKGM